jgi:hypothetical protein
MKQEKVAIGRPCLVGHQVITACDLCKTSLRLFEALTILSLLVFWGSRDLNHRGLILLAIAVLAASGSPLFAQAGSAGDKSLRAVRTDDVPVLDGRLDEALWQQAAVISDFHEVSPNEYAPPSEETRFRVIYGKDALYIGAEFTDREPQNIVAKVMRQGDFSEGEDGLKIILDPFNNGRSGYVFQLTPNAIRGDGLFRNVTDINWDWEAIWDAATEIHDTGWTAEIAIPFKTLSFNPSNGTWGINFTRTIGRRKEDIGWVSYNRSQNPANSGSLVGMTGLEQGLGLDIVPGLRVSRIARYDPVIADQTSTDFEPSLDIFYKPAPSLTAALTINTDFSGTGADSRQVNLTRFSLFFPEKRQFFLQDNDIFEFGRIGGPRESGAVTQATKESGRPFFSRRIGLGPGGETIPIDGGIKVTGRLGRWEYGVLNIVQSEYADLGAANLFVGRVAANVLEESSLGAIMTNGNPTGEEDNTLLGVDFRYLNTRLAGGKTVEGALWYQQTDTTGLDGNDSAMGVRLSAPNTEGWSGEVNYRRIEENFNPALGFVSQTDVATWFAKTTYTWRPDNSVFRSISSVAKIQRVDKLDGDFDTQIVSIDFISLENHSSDVGTLFTTLYREQLTAPFEISDGVIIPPGRYSWDRFCTRGNTGEHRILRFSGYVCTGEFYDGDRDTVSANFTWRPSKHLRMDAGYTINYITLPYGDFKTRLATLRADIAFTSTWYWENFVQYDDVSDSLGLNSIMRWIPVAGREFLLVFNRDFIDIDEQRTFKSNTTDLTARIGYTFRF